MEAIINESTTEKRGIFPETTGKAADEWKAAVQTWRVPYWDWARKQSWPDGTGSYEKGYNNFGMPYVFMLPEVPIYLPGKPVMYYKNPLVDFENPKKVDGKPLKFGDKALGDWAIKDFTRGYNKKNPAQQKLETLPVGEQPSLLVIADDRSGVDAQRQVVMALS